jgi:acyl-CoA thioester hydrolase
MTAIENEKMKAADGKNTFTYSLVVRDYELDSHGVVNHAVYLNYFEEARKQYLGQLGFDFRELLKRNIGFVVTHYELDYVRSLIGGDSIDIETTMTRMSRLKFQFEQNIFLSSEKTPVLRAKNIIIPINHQTGRPQWSEELDGMLVDFPVPKNNEK